MFSLFDCVCSAIICEVLFAPPACWELFNFGDVEEFIFSLGWVRIFDDINCQGGEIERGLYVLVYVLAGSGLLDMLIICRKPVGIYNAYSLYLWVLIKMG